MSHLLESEKQLSESSSSDGASKDHQLDMADGQKAQLGQTPFPVQLPEEPAPPLDRSDPKAPTPEKEKEEGEDPLAHLPEHEAAIIRRQLDIPVVKPGYKDLYRYATRNDLLIMLVSGICAIAAGAAMPLMTIVFGSLAGTFSGFTQDPSSAASQFSNQVNHLTLYFIYLAVGEFVTVYCHSRFHLHWRTHRRQDP